MLDAVIKNASIVTPSGIINGYIGVRDGKIAEISSDLDGQASGETIDAGNNYVLPGIIDPHTHFRDPGFTYKEDWQTGSSAAAAGGVTMVVGMPNVEPASTTPEKFELHKAEASKKSIVDFGLAGGVGAESLDQSKPLATAGAIFIKTLMGGYNPKERPDLKEWLPVLDNGELLQVFKRTGKTGLVQCVHAEDEELRTTYMNEVKREGRTDPAAYAFSRPNIVEAYSIQKAIFLAREAGCKLRIVHLGSKEGISLAKRARDDGQFVSLETCPHYLTLTNDDLRRVGPLGIVNPPMKWSEDRDALINGIRDGVIDTLGTDHAPHTPEEKTRGRDDIFKSIAGFCGVETSLSIMLTLVNNNKFSLTTLAKVMSENVARVFGIYPKKGALLPGSDADLTIVDINRASTIRANNLHSKGKVTPFDGMGVKGVPILTMVRGVKVMDAGKIVGRPGHGQFVPGTAYQSRN